MARPNQAQTRTIVGTSTGREFEFEPISQYFRNKIHLTAQQRYKKSKPTPPTYHNDMIGKDMPNHYDEGYQAALNAWNEGVNGELIVLCILFAARYTLKDSDRDAALATLRESSLAVESEEFDEFLAEFAHDIPEPETLADQLYKAHSGQHPTIRYVVDYVLERHSGDIERLLTMLQAEVGLEEAVQNAADSFQGDIQGQVDLVVHHAEIGTEV